MVYISSPSILTASRQSVMQSQSDLNTVQTELSSGLLADAGLSLGGQSGQLVSLSMEHDRLKSITESNAVTTTRLSATTAAIDTIRTAASSFLSALTSASAGAEPASLSTTASNALAGLTSSLNTAVGSQFIFAGINTAVQPMTTYAQSPVSASKQAVDTAFSTAFGGSQTSATAASVSGTAMQSFLDTTFASLFGGTSYATNWSSASDQVTTSQISGNQTTTTSVSANQTAFKQLVQAYTMVTEFGTSAFSSSAYQAVIASATKLVTSAVSGLTDIESGVGITQNAISNANDGMAAQMTVLTTQSGTLDSVDTAALTIQLSNLQTQITASYEMTAKLQKLSLVNYLS